MQKIVFLRHGQQNYSDVQDRKFIGHGIDLATLTKNGIEMAESISFDNRFDNAEIIVSSPLTRALHTAAIISKNRQLDIKVELDLQEWIADLSFKYSSEDDIMRAEETLYAIQRGMSRRL